MDVTDSEHWPQAKDGNASQGEGADQRPHRKLPKDGGYLEVPLADLTADLGSGKDDCQLDHQMLYMLYKILFHTLPVIGCGVTPSVNYNRS